MWIKVDFSVWLEILVVVENWNISMRSKISFLINRLDDEQTKYIFYNRIIRYVKFISNEIWINPNLNDNIFYRLKVILN